MQASTPGEVLDFWFAPEHKACWFRSTEAFDRDIRQRFLDLWQAGRDGELEAWRETPEGALALVILFDQFPLNMFRDQAQGFVTEAKSREIAEFAIAAGFESHYNAAEKAFLYLPFMHSEDPADQDRSVELFAAAGLQDNLRWARHHRDIVRRFGRFPHRNLILGRESTAAEEVWLASPEAFNP